MSTEQTATRFIRAAVAPQFQCIFAIKKLIAECKGFAAFAGKPLHLTTAK